MILARVSHAALFLYFLTHYVVVSPAKRSLHMNPQRRTLLKTGALAAAMSGDPEHELAVLRVERLQAGL